MRGADKILQVLDAIRADVVRNECRASDALLAELASALETMRRLKMPRHHSREDLARSLGVSVRTAERYAHRAGVASRRDGFKNVYYTDEDIEQIRRCLDKGKE